MNQIPVKQPTLIIVRGLPGSGKTYLTTELVKAFNKDDVVMLDPDAIDLDSTEYKEHVKIATAQGVDPKLHLYRFLRGQAYKGIADGKTIVWNQPFTSLEIFDKMMVNLHLQAAEHDTKLRVLVVEVEVDPAIAKDRVDQRKQSGGHGPSEGTFARFTQDYHSFSEHGYTTVAVRGNGDVSESVNKVQVALNELG